MNAVGMITAAYHPNRLASKVGPEDAAVIFCAAPTVAVDPAAISPDAISSAPSTAVAGPIPPMKAFARSFLEARSAALSSCDTSRRTSEADDSRRRAAAAAFLLVLTADSASRIIDLDDDEYNITMRNSLNTNFHFSFSRRERLTRDDRDSERSISFSLSASLTTISSSCP
jgi:hypothetical protein